MNTSAKPVQSENNGDWLGYGVYADTLWARIERALDKDDLGDDPLVIGLFGEWGAGKSYLLDLIHTQAKKTAQTQIENRLRDGGNFSLTIPVFFQPWKYEHEEHLQVPLMLHIFYALEKYTNQARTFEDKVGAATDVAWEVIKKGIPFLVKQAKKLTNGNLAAIDPSMATLAAGGLATAEILSTQLKARKIQPDPLKSYKYSGDGRFFYEMNEALKDVTRPNRTNGQLKKHFNHPLRINFVVFIDDLDRCLPEKAVQTLELIKTMFNVDSFAFVLALDDEVIERGIAHRYKDYALVDKKQHMPITGFEYLEKIVHLPFRLPQLTSKQARDFFVFEENRIVGNRQHWFTVTAMRRTILSAEIQRTIIDASIDTKEVGNLPKYSVLTELFIKSFDAYVPRKMVRVIELMHQVATIAIERGKPLSLPHSNFDEIKPELSGGRDVRVVFTLMLLQLFQPEFFRLLRRKEIAFPTLLAAFAGEKGGLNSTEVSEIDLWTWAVFRKATELIPNEAKGEVNFRPSYSSEVIKLIGDHSQSRYISQQIRLPIVEKLVEHMQVQRHVFSPIKLIAALAQSLGDSAKTLQIADYYALLGDHKGTVYDQNTEKLQAGDPISGSVIFDRSKEIATLVNAITEPDRGAQANLASRLELPEGKKLSLETSDPLTFLLNSWLDTEPSKDRVKHLLEGLSYICPWIDWENGGRDLWNLVSSAAYTDQDRVEDVLDLIPALSRMLKAGWLSESKEIDTVKQALLHQLASTGLKPEPRAQVGDALGAIGDPRFGFKYALARRQKGDAKEAPSGFVSIDNDKFYISRYLVTVAQYEVFRQSKEFNEWSTSRPNEIRAETPDWTEQLANLHRPVVKINWHEASAYAQWLQRCLIAGELGAISVPEDYELRLPNEHEWNYAAQSGFTDKLYPWGDEVADIDQRANVNRKVGHVTTVGCYEANDFGLFDMAGNVWEWQVNKYENNSDLKSLRGGSWVDRPDYAYCSFRVRAPAESWDNDIGFRLAFAPQILYPET